MGKYFGTDGVRGYAGRELTCEIAYKIGRFLGWHLSKDKEKPRALIGKDTRLSCDMLENGIIAGLLEGGANAYMLGVTTTPSVSYLVEKQGFDLGIMISASHNPYYDNGIKLLNEKGEKLGDEITDKIEAYLDNDIAFLGLNCDLPRATGEKIGRAIPYNEGADEYINHLISMSPSSLGGLKIGIDLANGSGYRIGKAVFEGLGANITVINDTPNGININENAGSTHIEGLRELVKKESLDFGFALDGDGDRCICVDKNGEIIDGDHILYILARELQANGELYNNTVVLTVMSNLGLINAFNENGIKTKITDVGDRFVYEEMVKGKYSLGGEQSGHIILSKYANTGDGILTAIMVASCLAKHGVALTDLCKNLTLYPQITVSLPVKNKATILENKLVKKEIERAKLRLDMMGRLIVRPSGTENKIRITVEGPNHRECDEIIEALTTIIYSEDNNGNT